MLMKVLSPELAQRAFELAQKPYKPKPILDLKEQIEAKTRLAEFRASMAGQIDENLVHEIVALKLQLDGLYLDYVEGKIS